VIAALPPLPRSGDTAPAAGTTDAAVAGMGVA